MKLPILFEDEDFLATAKPAGLLSIPDRFDATLPSAHHRLEAQTGARLWVVHRLDRDTSGVLLFAKTEAAHREASMLFEEGSVGKYYAALVHGRPTPPEGRVEAPIAAHPAQKGKMIVHRSGKVAATQYRVAQAWPLYSLVEIGLLTGRTHQIRVHMQHIGNPVLCDPLYGDGQPFFLSSIKRKYNLSKSEEAERPLLARTALHAYRLQFSKRDGVVVSAEASLPKDMAAVVQQLSKQGGVNSEE